MALARVKTWISGEVLTASDLNAEFNNILNNGTSLVTPFGAAVSMGGFTLYFDAASTIGMTSTASGVILAGGTLREPTEDTITAFATGGQTNATALSIAKKYHRISVCATAADSVKLPASTAGQAHFVRNDGAAAAQVFGTSPDTINGVATGTGLPLPTGAGTWYVCCTSGNWLTAPVAAIAGGFPVTFTAAASTSVTLPASGTLAILGANTFTGAQTTNATSGFNESKTTVASAATPDIWTSTGNVIDYTGTVTATGFAAAPQAGVRRTLVCAGAAVFTAGANVLIQGVVSAANYTATAGDIITVVAITTTQFRLFINPVTGIPGKQPTRQVLTSGTGATYTTPSGCIRINVRMVGSGAGGAAANTNSGASGTDTTFSTLTAAKGVLGNTAAGAGGAGGAGTNGDINISGNSGQGGCTSGAGATAQGGNGGNSFFGGAGGGGAASTAGSAAATNSGSGGGGAGGGAATTSGGGGGAGAYVEKLILAPSATYTYTVGAGGTGGAAGGTAGGNGAAGIIVVDEYYN